MKKIKIEEILTYIIYLLNIICLIGLELQIVKLYKFIGL